MRARVGVLLAITSTVLGGALVACIDLFHSTSDVLTACQRDAGAPGCEAGASGEAGVDAATDFCAWSGEQARANAQRACAWLGACESPLGRNAFGSCMFQALLAYDCAANPDHPVKGTTHGLWDCLWQAQTCAAVGACVFPQGSQECGGADFVACATQGGAPPNADVRVECLIDGGRPNGENCAMWGQTCGGDFAVGVCAGGSGDAALSCHGSECDGTKIHFCGAAGGDIGIDCADNGAQRCGGFPGATNVAWVACLPLSDAGACQPSESVQCTNGTATSCPAGIPESINCLALLQDVNACTPGSLSPPFDWTSPCAITSDAGQGADASDASTCSESCSGTKLTGCYRGAAFPLDCAEVGLGPCHTVTTDQGNAQNVACAHP